MSLPILETVDMSLILRKSLFYILGTVSNFIISRSYCNNYRMETPYTTCRTVSTLNIEGAQGSGRSLVMGQLVHFNVKFRGFLPLRMLK